MNQIFDGLSVGASLNRKGFILVLRSSLCTLLFANVT